MSHEDYLWDRSGTADPDVVALERALSGLAHDPSRQPVPVPSVTTERRPWIWMLSAAVLLVGLGSWLAFGRGSASTGLQLRVVADGRVLDAKTWFVATAETARLALGEIGEFELSAGSRLQVMRVAEDQTVLYLEQGRLQAVVSPDAKPRFFQVVTPTVRCVDLGCRYELTVAADGGDTHIAVSRGQVAFELDGRDAYVPSGAECTATQVVGLGTPRFLDGAAEVRELLDLIDRTSPKEPSRRADLASKLAASVSDPRDTLPLWHLLRDHSATVRITAEAALVDLVGRPGARTKQGFTADDWRSHLEIYW